MEKNPWLDIPSAIVTGYVEMSVSVCYLAIIQYMLFFFFVLFNETLTQ